MRSLCSMIIAGCIVSMSWGCYEPLPDLNEARVDLSGEVLAIPGVVGFGAHTPGGRGGEVVRVTSLAANGPGSLAEAINQKGARTILFEVGGVISLREHIVISHPFITLAGQSAPSPGVTLSGAGLVVRTHDVVIQHLKIRPGDDPDGPEAKNRDAIAIEGAEDGSRDVYNIVVDHCSLSWGVDETFSTWYKGVRDVTLSNSIVSESLDDSLHREGPHSKAILIGDSTRRFSMIGNVLAHNVDRNPILKGDASALMVNTLVYDPGRWPLTFFQKPSKAPSLFTAVGNHFIRGNSTPIEHRTIMFGEDVRSGTRVYLDDIIGLGATTPANDPWSLVDNRARRVDDSSEYVASEPPVWIEGLDLAPASSLEATLLDTVGARPWDRDPIDARVITQIRQRTGRTIDSPDDVGNLPPEVRVETHATWTLPERPHDDDDGDGRTNLEAWLDTFSHP